MSHFLQFLPAACLPVGRAGRCSCFQDRFVMPVPCDRASASYKTLYTLTCDLLTIKLVPRHSYNSIGFVPVPIAIDRKKMRHTSFIPAGTRTLPRFGFPAPACIHSATLTKLYRRAVSKNAQCGLNWPRAVP